MHFILGAFGSAGDVHPMLGIGRALQARGHEVTVLATGYFAPMIRQAQLRHIDPMPGFDYRQAIEHPDLWNPLKGGRVLLKLVEQAIEPVAEFVRSHHVPGQTVFVGTSLALGARLAQAAYGVPYATVHLSPCFFRSRTDSPKFFGLIRPEWLPNVLKDLQYHLIDIIGLDRRLGPTINRVLQLAGKPAARSIMGSWFHSPELVLALFPDWFAGPQPEWPPPTVLTGFPLYDERDSFEPAAELKAFLSAGEAPIVFTPGSANIHRQGRRFFEAAVGACQRLGRRGLLLTRFANAVPKQLPKSVRHFDYVPFSWLLPRATALVHHGGIGTLSQGLSAGIPQLVMPMNFDQFDNANRLKQLGCGRALSASRFAEYNVAHELGELLSSPDVTKSCQLAANRIRGTQPFETICSALEQFAARSAEPHSAVSA